MAHFFILENQQRRDAALELIKALNPARTYSVEVKEYRSSRSNSQNRTYWMWLNALAKDTGHSADDLHEMFKVRVLGTEEKIILGKAITVGRSTTTLNTKDFAEYMTTIEGIAASIGITLPHPDDYRYAMMLDEPAKQTA